MTDAEQKKEKIDEVLREVDAMRKCLEALRGLSPHRIVAVLGWVAGQFGLAIGAIPIIPDAPRPPPWEPSMPGEPFPDPLQPEVSLYAAPSIFGGHRPGTRWSFGNDPQWIVGSDWRTYRR